MSRKGYPSDLADAFNLRLPSGMRKQIKDQAASNHRSMNAEIIVMLSDAMRSKAATAGQSLAAAPAVASNPPT